MKARYTHLAAFLTITALLSSSILIVDGSKSCSTPHLDEHLVGHACTAERIVMGTTWSWNDSQAATPAQKLFLLLVTIVFIASILPRTIIRVSGFTWFNRRLNLTRGGPSPGNIFLPYLFATHGW